MSGLRRLPTARATTERFYVGGNFRPSSDVTEGPFPYFPFMTLGFPKIGGILAKKNFEKSTKVRIFLVLRYWRCVTWILRQLY